MHCDLCLRPRDTGGRQALNPFTLRQMQLCARCWAIGVLDWQLDDEDATDRAVRSYAAACLAFSMEPGFDAYLRTVTQAGGPPPLSLPATCEEPA